MSEQFFLEGVLASELPIVNADLVVLFSYLSFEVGGAAIMQPKRSAKRLGKMAQY
jgi:hypothetical protein